MPSPQLVHVGPRVIGRGQPPFIIAEIAQAHGGSLRRARDYVDLAARAGVDAVKFQTHIAAAESTRDEEFRVPIPGFTGSRFEYWESVQFSRDEWFSLKQHSAEKGLIFFSSPFSVEAVELLRDLDVPLWKVGSGELRHRVLLDAIAATRKPVLLSTGMASQAEIDDAVSYFSDRDVPIAVLQCTSRYPTRLEEVGLNVIEEMAERYGVPTGLSDHSGSPWPSIAAMARGASVLEAHLIDIDDPIGPDADSSLSPNDFLLITEARGPIFSLSTNPVDKDSASDGLDDMRELFGRSLAPRIPLAAGSVLSADVLQPKKPGTGIPPEEIDRVVGRRLRRSISPERILRWNDLDD